MAFNNSIVYSPLLGKQLRHLAHLMLSQRRAVDGTPVLGPEANTLLEQIFGDRFLNRHSALAFWFRIHFWTRPENIVLEYYYVRTKLLEQN